LSIERDIEVVGTATAGMTGLELASALRVEAGVSGYVLKNAPASRLAETIRRVQAGGRVIDPACR
jgi:hypothetical protein